MMSNSDKRSQTDDTERLKRSQYARQQGISYRTALRWWRAGALKGYQAPTGTRIITEGETPPATRPEKVAV
jgi:predicted site-specific integrase-resolvase